MRICSSLFPNCNIGWLQQSWQTHWHLLGVHEWMVLVHIGKSGGLSVRRVLEELRVNTAENTSHLGIYQFHVSRVRPLEALTTRKLLFLARDPVSRFISAFNYMHPRGGHREGQAFLRSITLRHMYACFDDVDEFAAAIRNTRNASSECVGLARFFLWRFNETGDEVQRPPGTLPPPKLDHISMNLAFYYGPFIHLLPSLQYALVEMETLAEDTYCVLARWFPESRPPHAMPSENTEYPRRQANFSTLEPQHRSDLREALSGEYAIRKQLRRHAPVCARREEEKWFWGRFALASTDGSIISGSCCAPLVCSAVAHAPPAD